MLVQLNQNELRIIGCLIEKSLTTPDHYPLSLNALTNACNQKSNRDPVLTLSELEVQESVDSLNEKRLLMSHSDRGSRVYKYKHRFCNTDFSDLQLSGQELGILCVLFLRGAQTPGELRTRSNRLCHFDNVLETEAVLKNMQNTNYVSMLPREPGKRESRYIHRFMKDTISSSHNDYQNESINAEPVYAESNKPLSHVDRVSNLEEQVELMQLEIDELREKLEALIST